MNTKDMTHQRRSNGNAGANVTAAANITITMKKDQFLAAIYFHAEYRTGEKQL